MTVFLYYWRKPSSLPWTDRKKKARREREIHKKREGGREGGREGEREREREDSLGVGLNEHFLTYGFLAPSPVPTKAPSTLSTAAKSRRSAGNMVNEYVS